MECNKDEAIKAKEIAERKLTENDISGAKIFASKAYSLFPELEGLSQFLDILDIYVASERKANGEVDWYGILGVHPQADDETIKKSYRKLILALHPDKNKAIGAEGAFKIVSEAWSFLSDRVKRVAYNEKHNISALYQNVAVKNPPGVVEKKDNEKFTSKLSPVGNPSSSGNPPTHPEPCNPSTSIFWTQCRTCMMKFMFPAMYQNQRLLCPSCCQSFLAMKLPLPPVKRHPASIPWSHYQQQQGGHPVSNASSDSGKKFPPTPTIGTPVYSGVGLNIRPNVPQGSSLNFGGFRSMSTPATAAQPAYTFQPMGEKLKRECEEAVSDRVHKEFMKSCTVKSTGSGLPSYNVSTADKKEKPAKKRRKVENKASIGGRETVNQMAGGNGCSGQGNHCRNQMGKDGAGSTNNLPKSIRELSEAETLDMLMGKARMEIHEKLQEWKSLGKAGKEVGKKPTSQSTPQESGECGMKKATNMKASRKDAKTSVRPRKSSLFSVTTSTDTPPTESAPGQDGSKGRSLSVSTTGSITEMTAIMTMDVPDSDFYDFDKDRIEDSFAKDQVWAVYGDEDGMPRYYAIIREIISREPFEIGITWLNSKNNNEFGPLNWVDCGFAKSCGDFRKGKNEISKTLNSFSHRVKWTKGLKGVIKIYPEKGDVWALYRNWSSDWNMLTPNDVIQQYDMVEVLQDYNEEQGVAVVPLVKVAEFKSVFQQNSDTRKIWTIPREEMFRFSHQVASYIITGQGTQTAPVGCRELDTAALPLELLQVATKPEEESGTTVQGASPSAGLEAMAATGDAKPVVKQLMVYSRRSKGKSGV